MAINVADALSELQHKAMHDRELAERFLAIRNNENPLKAFCALCRECGYEIYEMDVIAAGEEAYASMRRATNGGGENSPKLHMEDDLYEEFYAPLLK